MYETIREICIQYGWAIVATLLVGLFFFVLFRPEGKPIHELTRNKRGWDENAAREKDRLRAEMRKEKQSKGEIPIEKWEI